MWHVLALLITLTILAASIFGAIKLIHHLADKSGPLNLEKRVGVRGWLTFFVGSLMLWGPVIGIARHFSEISKAEALYPNLKLLPQWGNYTVTLTVAVVLLAAWQMHVGWKICRSRDWAAIEYAKKFLLITPMLIFCVGFINVVVLDQSFPLAESFAHMLAIAFINAIWYAYLIKSKRIKSTYVAGIERVRSALNEERPARHVKHDDALLMSVNQKRDAESAIVDSVGELDVFRASNMQDKISQHRLERLLGNNPDEQLYDKCLVECEFDQLRAVARYKRVKEGL